MDTQQQFITHRYNVNEENEGMVKQYITPSGVIYPVICVKRWNTFDWIRLQDLSSTLWMRHRHDLEPGLMSNFTYLSPGVKSSGEEDNKLVTSLLATLSIEQRKKWLSENIEYKDKICIECGSFDPEKKKCIHHDCPGMCTTCFDIKNKSGFENCACCNKKQEMTCPICQEDFPTDNLVKSEQCGHRICWSCFGRSVKSSRPLSHCPLCRGVFCEKLVDLEEYDLDDMPLLDDDDLDDMPPLDTSDFATPASIRDVISGNIMTEVSDDLTFDTMARAQEGMDFDAIIAAIANGSVSVRNDNLAV